MYIFLSACILTGVIVTSGPRNALPTDGQQQIGRSAADDTTSKFQSGALLQMFGGVVNSYRLSCMGVDYAPRAFPPAPFLCLCCTRFSQSHPQESSR